MRHTKRMSDQPDITQPEPAEQQDSAPLFVSLYIVLLAFFIMLTSMATVDKVKMQEAQESLAKAFSFMDIQADVPEFFAEAGIDLSVTQFFNELQNIASSFVPLEKLSVYTHGNTMEIVFPAEFLFEAEQATFRETNQPFVKRVADVLARWQKGLRLEVEILVGNRRGQVRLIETGHGQSLSIFRATAISNYLLEQGLSAKSLAPGLDYNGAENITLRFQVRDVDTSRLNLQPPTRTEATP